MLKCIIYNTFIIVSIACLIELLYKSKVNTKYRLYTTAIKTRVTIWGNQIMRKYKLLYRIVIELIIIWFIFEWNNSYIINGVESILGKIKVFPIVVKLLSILKFVSPFGRTLVKDLYFLHWFNICTGIVCFCFCVFFVLTFVDSFEHFVFRLIILLLLNLVIWYGTFGICWLVCKIPIKWSGLCWLVCIGLCLMLELLGFYIHFVVLFNSD